MRVFVPISVGGWTRLFSRWDIIAILLILGLLVFLGEASRNLFEPLAELQRQPPSLDPRNLPEYAARTTLRMLIAMVLSLIFTFTYATFAAKSRSAERLLVPLLDILQSVPILGFISVTVVFFMSLAPGRVLGAEFASIFAIFTFWRLDVPFAMPQLIWNMMMSMSGSWFFVVASEAISVGNTTVTLPGIGSYIALAIEHRDLAAVCWAIGTMLVVILIYDQVLFRPLVAWADRFRFEQEPGVPAPRSWVFDVLRRSRIVERLIAPVAALWRLSLRPKKIDKEPSSAPAKRAGRTLAFQFTLIVFALATVALWQVAKFAVAGITLHDVGVTMALGFATLARVVVLIAIASLIWVPIGVWVGTRPRVALFVQPVAQFLAAFPANLLFPIVVSGIVAWRLNPNIWLSPLMILGTQWYILFNVVAGAAAIPAELRSVAVNLRVRGWLWWRRIALPAVLPYYVTGAITASGGSWNASIVAEVASWGNEHLQADGLGAYIAEKTDAGDFHHIVLGIAVMSLFVVVINRVFWRPMYRYAERKFRLG